MESQWGTHIRFTGEIFLAAGTSNYIVRHDDGAVLTIVGFGTVVNSPGPTAVIDSPFTINNLGAAGCFAYTLDYNECNAAPAVIQFDHTECPVPVPGAVLLLGAA